MPCLISKASCASPNLLWKHKAPVSPSGAQAGLGWRAAAAQLREALPHAWAGPGNELSLWRSLGSLQDMWQPPFLWPKFLSLWEWQGTALPCAVGDCTCKCLKPECDNFPVNRCRVCRKFLDPASRIHSWLRPHSSAFSHHKLLGIWNQLTQGLQTMAYGPIPACSLF